MDRISLRRRPPGNRGATKSKTSPQKAPQQLGLSPQFDKKFSDRFGGTSRTTRASRGTRPLSTRASMHLILKSDLARGRWSFLTKQNRSRVNSAVVTLARRYGVKILSAANVGNHLHLHIRIQKRQQYLRFIRVVTARIAFAITGASKHNPLKNPQGQKISFWNQRPLTRWVHSFKDYLRLKDYIRINQIEGLGWCRQKAEHFVRESKIFLSMGDINSTA
ncbi:MAG: transposase [Pseudobdellovibrionaceae bacterium]